MTELSPDPLEQMDKRVDSIETRQREDANTVNQHIDALNGRIGALTSS